jgi:hypothetical protein
MLRRRWLRRLLRHAQRSCGAQHQEKNPTPDHFALVQQERQLRITLRATRPKSEERFLVAQRHAAGHNITPRRAPIYLAQKKWGEFAPTPCDARL